MSQIILDFGSGNTCRNDLGLIRETIDALAEVDSHKHEVVVKFQLFKSEPPNVALWPEVFTEAAIYARTKGYATTASVFDKESLEVLLLHDVPFVKIACRPDLYWMGPVAACTTKVYTSWPGPPVKRPDLHVTLACVRQYPASVQDYLSRFDDKQLHAAISDHTRDWALFAGFHPDVYECHFKMPKSRGPDAGPFARTPEQLKEIL